MARPNPGGRNRRPEDHDRDDRDRDGRKHKRRHPKPKPKHHKPAPKPKPPTTTTERLKALSKQTGNDAMMAAPGHYPPDPGNMQAVFTTGPGEAVEYNYVRVDGGNEEYALAQSEQSAPVPRIAGAGQTVTSGAANNPT
jgi:hypothetical protein